MNERGGKDGKEKGGKGRERKKAKRKEEKRQVGRSEGEVVYSARNSRHFQTPQMMAIKVKLVEIGQAPDLEVSFSCNSCNLDARSSFGSGTSLRICMDLEIAQWLKALALL